MVEPDHGLAVGIYLPLPHQPAKRPKRYQADRLDAKAVTPEIAGEWRAPRFRCSNPQPMNHPLWEWLVRTRIAACDALRKRFEFPSLRDETRSGAAWGPCSPLRDRQVLRCT